jgi:glycosyltransferase involved in cell wall biosynthesis
MKVSIVIPCYNQAHWLPDAIESAINQTFKCEVIVVNDGSPDNTDEVAKKYPVKLIKKENGGLSSARNAGIKSSKGDFILPLDADDKLDPTFVERCLGVDDIVSTYQQWFGDEDRLLSAPRIHPKYEDFLNGNQINCCSLFTKEMWEKLGGYDENMRIGYEDWDFWLRAAKAGYTITVIPEGLFYYRKHGHSMVDDATAKHEEIKAYILEKNK